MRFNFAAILCVLQILTVNGFEIKTVYESEGDLKIGFAIEDCNILPYDTALTRTLIASAIWTAERINLLKLTQPMSLGLSVYKVCTTNDFYDSIFQLFREQEKSFLLGIVGANSFSENVGNFCEVLGIRTYVVNKSWKQLVKISVELLSVLNWKDNVSVITQDLDVLKYFYKHTRRAWICVKDIISILETDLTTEQRASSIVVFGDKDAINMILNNLIFKQNLKGMKIIFAPLDGSSIEGLPDGSYIVQPIHAELFLKYADSPKIIPTPLLFDVANPIVSFTKNLTNFITENCNTTIYKLNCVRNKFNPTTPNRWAISSSKSLLNLLKIEPLATKFNYNVFQVENVTSLKPENFTRQYGYVSSNNVFQTLTKVFTYNVFDEVLLDLDENREEFNYTNNTYRDFCATSMEKCISECLNFKSLSRQTVFASGVIPRTDSWVFAFMSITILGIIFCLAIIVFIVIRICQRHVLEGNPTLSLLLLFIAIGMYACITPFALDGDASVKPSIYIARTLSVTLPYAAAFSLLLSRAILLATISKEVGFMSHVAGSIQSFLTLFIFGVQCALSLQVIRQCEAEFRDFLMVYLLSYNILLLVLLLCLCPMIMRSQRNYREGKYVTFATVIIACIWTCWIPCYLFLGEEWKDPMLCFGLVSTASALVGAIFIPRTYLMTVAAARDKFTSALPSLATATSTMDIYRASTQPLYDCVNVATINAINSRNGDKQSSGVPTAVHQYSTPADLEEEFVSHIDSQPSPDKVTRF